MRYAPNCSFKQNRKGQYGKELKFYKYRTMVPNADEILFEMIKLKPLSITNIKNVIKILFMKKQR